MLWSDKKILHCQQSSLCHRICILDQDPEISKTSIFPENLTIHCFQPSTQFHLYSAWHNNCLRCCYESLLSVIFYVRFNKLYGDVSSIFPAVYETDIIIYRLSIQSINSKVDTCNCFKLQAFEESLFHRKACIVRSLTSQRIHSVCHVLIFILAHLVVAFNLLQWVPRNQRVATAIELALFYRSTY
jgi:hypothetical protein